jgi:hypothetical protein
MSVEEVTAVRSQATPVYLVLDGSVILNAPVKDSWPHVINYPSWQDYSIVQHLSGEPGREGELVMLKKDDLESFPPYYARTIKLEPERRIIWKTYAEGSESFFGIVEFRLSELQGKTCFSYSVVYEFLVAAQDEREIDSFQRRRRTDYEAMLAEVIPKLRELVERSA